MKPFLKWAGGKRQLLPELLKRVPKFETYFEPFLGGGALLFDLMPKRAIISDVNSDLICCYLAVQFQLDELLAAIEIHRRNHSAEYFQSIRSIDRMLDRSIEDMGTVDRAARLMYINRACFNGIWRVSKAGYCNSPFGHAKTVNFPDRSLLKQASELLKSCTILSGDYIDAVATADSSSFVYFDPPYDPVSKTASFTGYSIHGFNRCYQEQLKNIVDRLTNRGCKVMVSNSYTDYIRDLYGDYNCVKVLAKRAINCKVDRRGSVSEILITNY